MSFHGTRNTRAAAWNGWREAPEHWEHVAVWLRVELGRGRVITAMSTQALNSESVRAGLKDVLLNHAGLYENLRAQAADFSQTGNSLRVPHLSGEFIVSGAPQ